MNPFLLFLLAIVSPFLLAITLLVPPYVGISAASYVIYDKGNGPHPLADKLTDVFYMFDVYGNLFTSWAQQMGAFSIPFYAVPLILLPFFGIVGALWLTGKLARTLMDIFQLGVVH